jgi:hypothetical protein
VSAKNPEPKGSGTQDEATSMNTDHPMHAAETKAWATVEAFKAHYAQWHPDEGSDALWNEHLIGMLKARRCRCEDMLQAVAEEISGTREFTALGLLLLGCRFSVEGVKACHDGRPADAWPYVVEAAYIAGTLAGDKNAGGAPGYVMPIASVRDIGRLGGKAAHAETDAMSAEVRAWCEQRLSEYSSLNQLCDGVIGARLNAAKRDTVRGWLTKWAKDWRAAGLWTH